ncbi:MAG: metallophosphoesterase [Phycisphaerales bacterium]|nr:metallophosphoesterase [Phycisphaerales bacterium]
MPQTPKTRDVSSPVVVQPTTGGDRLRVEIAGTPLWLLSDKAAWCEASSTVFIADLHLGKASTMRAGMLPVAPGVCRAAAEQDLSRIVRLLSQTNASNLVILGDLIHARQGRDEALLTLVRAWRDSSEIAPIEITLVRGNHDRSSGDPPSDWRIRCVDEGEALPIPGSSASWSLWHVPPINQRGVERFLAGHVHPVFNLRRGGISAGRSPCFHVFDSQITQRSTGLIVPAFGSLTGGAQVPSGWSERCERVVLCAEGRLIELPRAADA